MYQIKRSLGVSKEPFSQWVELNLIRDSIPKYVRSYKEVLLIVEDEQGQRRCIDFLAKPELYKDFSESNFSEWLELVNLTQVQFIQEPSTSMISYVKYCNLEQLGYYYSNNFPFIQFQPDYDKERDLMVTRHPFKTYQRFFDLQSLITVNGIIHRTSSDNSYSTIMDGLTTAKHSHQCILGMLDFSDVGHLVKHIPSISTIRALDGESLYKGFEFKTYKPYRLLEHFMVFAGWMVFQKPGVFEKIDDTTFRFYPEAFEIADKLKDCLSLYPYAKHLQVSQADLEDEDFRTSNILIEKLFSLEVTFIVSHEGQPFHCEQSNFFEGQFPKEIRSYHQPRFVITNQHGVIVDYQQSNRGDVWYYRLFNPLLNLNVPKTLRAKTFLESFKESLFKRPYTQSVIKILDISNRQLKQPE